MEINYGNMIMIHYNYLSVCNLKILLEMTSFKVDSIELLIVYGFIRPHININIHSISIGISNDYNIVITNHVSIKLEINVFL